jgi:hypothetical protein
MEHEITIWAYETPAQHHHKSSGWSFVDHEVSKDKDAAPELVLRCSRCDVCWHTGLPADDDWHDVDDLKAAATRFLVAEWFSDAPRRFYQLAMPLVIEDAPVYEPPKRRYTPAVRVDLSAQMSLFAVAA